MHTRNEFLFVFPDRNEAERICAAAESEVREVENLLSRHIHTSPLSSLNCSEGSVDVPDDLYFVLELCETMRNATCGYFDIAAVSGSQIRPAYKCTPADHSVERMSQDVWFDMGGFAKGYALEKVRTLMKGGGVRRALLNCGDSSVAAIGTHPFGDSWKVSPYRRMELTFDLKDSALSISGNGTSLVEHIVDPVTGKTVSGGRDIAVTGTSALICEILSTAMFAAPQRIRNAIMSDFEGYTFLEI